MRRGMIHALEHRTLLALLANLPDAPSVTSVVHQLFPGEDPGALLLTWAEELRGPTWRASPDCRSPTEDSRNSERPRWKVGSRTSWPRSGRGGASHGAWRAGPPDPPPEADASWPTVLFACAGGANPSVRQGGSETTAKPVVAAVPNTTVVAPLKLEPLMATAGRRPVDRRDVGDGGHRHAVRDVIDRRAIRAPRAGRHLGGVSTWCIGRIARSKPPSTHGRRRWSAFRHGRAMLGILADGRAGGCPRAGGR